MKLVELFEKLKFCLSKIQDQVHYVLYGVDRNLLVRSVSSVLWAFIFLFSIQSGGFVFYTLFFVLTLIAALEWSEVTKGSRWSYVPAIFVIAIPNASLAYLYSLPHGKAILTWLVLSVWCTDVFAYLMGKNFGKLKVVPSISPNKTWVGLFSGVACSAICTLLMSIILGIFYVSDALFIGVVIALLAQLGDCAESLIKRTYDVKDSGFIVPGHGGVLDRMDGYIFTAPCVACCIKYVSKFFVA